MDRAGNPCRKIPYPMAEMLVYRANPNMVSRRNRRSRLLQFRPIIDRLAVSIEAGTDLFIPIRPDRSTVMNVAANMTG